MKIYQTTPGIKEEIRDEGCYFLSILNIYSKVSGHDLTVKEVNTIYKVAVAADHIRKDCLIYKDRGVSGVASVASGLTRKHVYMKQVDGEGVYTHRIAKFQRKTSGGKTMTHFVEVGLDSDDVLYDGWPNSKTCRDGHIVDYRYILAEAI